MGKGGGSCLTKKTEEAVVSPTQPVSTSEPEKPALVVQEPQVAPAVKPESNKMTKKVYIIYYSTYGHILQMARSIKEGIDAIEGVEGVLYQVPETLPEDVLAKMHAAPKPDDIPIIDPHVIDQADGFVFGFPTRFGMMAAQMKAFFDATGQHWQKGTLVGKPATMFTSIATQGGGMETTLMTAVTQLAHHGMIYVPVGYSFGAALFDNSTVRGGSAWGAGTLAGADGSRQPSETELAFAKHQGTYFAKVVLKLAT